ncbi:MAG: hypothetical protein IJG64_04380 [Oscillospiraceae bacterium]|nr:hypothetical protein [Oscillospiraceae bacterium]
MQVAGALQVQEERKKSRIHIFAVGCLIGRLFFLAIYGFDVLVFTNDSFLVSGYIEKDIAQHYAGWLLYRYSPWQFPIGVGYNIDFPIGEAVTFTDSIPIFAIFFKCLSGILPETFQYFGLWVFICFILQGGFGALLASVFNDSLLFTAGSAGLFVMSPIFIERAFRHCALTSHFLIIGSLYFYFSRRPHRSAKDFVPFYILNRLAITVHPYFLPFVFGIFFAYCLELFTKKGRKAAAVAGFLGSILLTLLTGYVIGAFRVTGGNMASFGYGKFNMNLNAFINSWSKGIRNWSLVIMNRPYGPDDRAVEGFAYLGIGILFGLVLSAAVYLLGRGKKLFGDIGFVLSNHFGLIISSLALFVFAIGNNVYFGNLPIVSIPYPDWMIGFFGVFRANGRFGWIVVYDLLIILIAALSKTGKKWISFIPVILLAVQIADISGALIQKHEYFQDPASDHPGQSVSIATDNPFWTYAAQGCDSLIQYAAGRPNTNIDLAVIFGKRKKAVCCGVSARPVFEARDAMIEEMMTGLERGEFPDGILYVVAQLPEGYSEYYRPAGVNIYHVNSAYAITTFSLSPEQMRDCQNYGDFRLLEYPYRAE